MKLKSTTHYDEVEENTDDITDDGGDIGNQCALSCGSYEASSYEHQPKEIDHYYCLSGVTATEDSVSLLLAPAVGNEGS